MYNWIFINIFLVVTMSMRRLLFRRINFLTSNAFYFIIFLTFEICDADQWERVL